TGNGQTIPALSYYNLGIIGPDAVAAGPIEVFNGLTVGLFGTFAAGNVTVHASIANAGTLQFAQLSIPAGKTVTAFNSFSASTINVAGTFIPVANAIITGALTGTGSVHVTSTATPNSFASQ